jgi:hypothetical protein
MQRYISGSGCGFNSGSGNISARSTRAIRFVPVRGARGDKDFFGLYRYRAYRYTLYGLRRRAHRSPAQSVSVSPRCASAQKVQLDRDVRFTLEFSLDSPARKPDHARGAGHTRTHVTCACAHVHVSLRRWPMARYASAYLSLELDRPIEGDTANATRAQPGTPGRAHATTICRCVLCTLCSDCGKWYKNRE